MEMQSSQAVAAAAPAAAAQGPSLSVWQRAVAVFARPGSAWSGLETRVQWWFPMIIIMLANVGFAAGLWERAIMPTQIAAMEQQVADGKMPAESLERAEAMMSGPTGLVFAVVPWLVISPVINLFVALILWVVVAFILGGKLPYRLALEVGTWSGLINLPALVITGILAWTRGTMEGMHLSLAALLPEPEGPARALRIVSGILDGLGPFAIWWLVVVILGASILSGVPRKRVGWAVGIAYLVMVVFFAVLGTLMRRGS
jgi:hypothetical protein